MSNRNIAYLSLGSNLGDRMGNLQKARQLIEENVGAPQEISSLYETAPWGYQSRNPFYNCCLSLHSTFEPVPLLEALLGIEKEMGRIRYGRSAMTKMGYSDRLVDIDILYYGEMVIRHSGLILPHPSIADRRFVLEPLSEIAPEMTDPVLGLTVREMLEQCSDTSLVTKMEDQDGWNSKPSQNI